MQDSQRYFLNDSIWHSKELRLLKYKSNEIKMVIPIEFVTETTMLSVCSSTVGKSQPAKPFSVFSNARIYGNLEYKRNGTY